jgi:protein-S-isoprenylcysteine O-methyltransferase Ste14
VALGALGMHAAAQETEEVSGAGVVAALLRIVLCLVLIYAIKNLSESVHDDNDASSTSIKANGRILKRFHVAVLFALLILSFILSIAHAAAPNTTVAVLSQALLLAVVLLQVILVALVFGSRRLSGHAYVCSHLESPSVPLDTTEKRHKRETTTTDSPMSDTFLVAQNRENDTVARSVPHQIAMIAVGVICSVISLSLEIAILSDSKNDLNAMTRLLVPQTFFNVIWIVSSVALVFLSTKDRSLHHDVHLPLYLRVPISLSPPRALNRHRPSTKRSGTDHGAHVHIPPPPPCNLPFSYISPSQAEFSTPATMYTESKDITDLTDPFAVSSLSLTYAPSVYAHGSMDPCSRRSSGCSQYDGFPHRGNGDDIDPGSSPQRKRSESQSCGQGHAHPHTGHPTRVGLGITPEALDAEDKARRRERFSKQWGNIPTAPPPREVRERMYSISSSPGNSPTETRFPTMIVGPASAAGLGHNRTESGVPVMLISATEGSAGAVANDSSAQPSSAIKRHSVNSVVEVITPKKPKQPKSGRTLTLPPSLKILASASSSFSISRPSSSSSSSPSHKNEFGSCKLDDSSTTTDKAIPSTTNRGSQAQFWTHPYCHHANLKGGGDGVLVTRTGDEGARENTSFDSERDRKFRSEWIREDAALAQKLLRTLSWDR